MPRVTISISHEMLNKIKPHMKHATVEQYVMWALQDKLEEDQKSTQGRF